MKHIDDQIPTNFCWGSDGVAIRPRSQGLYSFFFLIRLPALVSGGTECRSSECMLFFFTIPTPQASSASYILNA